jgi:hypothetical protein
MWKKLTPKVLRYTFAHLPEIWSKIECLERSDKGWEKCQGINWRIQFNEIIERYKEEYGK